VHRARRRLRTALATPDEAAARPVLDKLPQEIS
jgi:hypothetical protein